MRHCLKLRSFKCVSTISRQNAVVLARTGGNDMQIQPRDTATGALSSGVNFSALAGALSSCCSASTAACASTFGESGKAASFGLSHRQQQRQQLWTKCITTIWRTPQPALQAAPAAAWQQQQQQQQQRQQRCLHTNTPSSRKWLPDYNVPDPEDELEVILDEIEEDEAGEEEVFDSEWVDGGVVNTSSSHYTDEDEYDVEFDEAWEDEEDVDDLKHHDLSEDDH